MLMKLLRRKIKSPLLTGFIDRIQHLSLINFYIPSFFLRSLNLLYVNTLTSRLDHFNTII